MSELPYSLLITLFALIFVLVVAWLVIKFLAGLSRFKASGSELELKSSLVVGPKERLLVVNFRDSDYLIGVTGQSVSVVDKKPQQERSSTSENQTDK